ncbi:MAG: sensor histidine kinase, partial [Actinomycetes bacterium]
MTGIVVIVVGVSLFVGGTMLTAWVRATLRNDLVTRNERVLAVMAQAMQNGRVPAELFSTPAQITNEIGQRLGPDMFGAGTDVREVLSSTYFYLDGPGLSRLKVRGVDDAGRLVLFGRDGPALPDPASSVSMSARVPTQLGDLTLHAVSPLAPIDDSVGALAGALWLGLPMLTVFAGLMTWLVTGRALAPVGQITSRVRGLSAATMDARVPVPDTDDEIARLAITMNDMLERLERASATQQQFISDASHELRSPVASIRAQLETALRFPDAVDWPDVANVVLAEDERLEHLVSNLLAVARLEEGRTSPRTEVDLDEVVVAQRRRVTAVPVDITGVSAGRVWGNLDELTSVVRNLIDNAVRHSSAVVSVTLHTRGPWVVLCVADDGPGVPTDQRERIFERF